MVAELQDMVGNRRDILLITFVLCCHIVGLLLFCNGFLLKRIVIPEYSKCTSFQPNTPQEHPPSNKTDPFSNSKTCTGLPRTFKRVVWLLIDALRYDFMVYDPDLLHPVPIYRNKIPYVRDLLKEQPRNAKLFKFVADPPTTTMQRLKALTTGGLPTFIDIGSNFNSYKILEDNLIYQAKGHARNVTFMGDDTWLGLYPDMFTKVFDYPSLNVKDLHTVDDGVITHLLPELAQNDADLVVGHFLGVDHVGHTYGPSHWTMGDKLTQMNDVLQSVLSSVDENTIVFVFGDHGMTSTGDHGGETELETDAALLVYSPQPLFDPRQPPGRPVYQIDLVPTVSLLLGIPIPFSSLGMIIPEVILPYSTDSNNSSSVSELGDDGFTGRVTLDFLNALRINAQQIQEYLVTYAQYSGDLPSSVFQSLNKKLDDAIGRHKDIKRQYEQHSGYVAQSDLSNAAALYVEYMKGVKEMCQSVWAKFDDVPILEGLILLLSVVIATPLMLLNIEQSLPLLQRSLYSGVVLGIAVITVQVSVITKFEFSTNGILFLVLLICFYTLTASNVIFIFYKMKFVYHYFCNALQCITSSIVSGQFSLLHVLSVGISVLYAVAMLSNSFVLYEGDMVAFFLQSIIVCFAVRRLQLYFSQNTKHRHYNAYTATLSAVRSIAPHVGVMVCVRMLKVFYACRDLQIQDGCEATTFIHALPTATELIGWLAKWRYFASCVAVLSVPLSLIALLLFAKSVTRHMHSWLLGMVYVGMPMAGLCVAGFWAMQNLSHPTLQSLTPLQHVVLPRAVYLVGVSIILLCVFRPLKAHTKLSTMSVEYSEVDFTFSVKRNQVDNRSETLDHPPNTRLRKHKLTERDGELSTNTDSEFKRHHLSTSRRIISLVVLILLVAIWIPVALLLNDGLALSAFIMAVQVALSILALGWTEKGTSWPICIFWALLSCHFFFGFGHHATITSLRFEAGFVGIHGEMTAFNLPFAGALVGLNTLASQILFGLGLPLLSVLNTRDSLSGSTADGVLRVGLQYITFHSVKMLVTVFAASIHRRHLMVWWVFAPRFLYEGAFQVTTDVCVILAYALVARLEQKINSSFVHS